MTADDLRQFEALPSARSVCGVLDRPAMDPRSSMARPACTASTDAAVASPRGMDIFLDEFAEEVKVKRRAPGFQGGRDDLPRFRAFCSAVAAWPVVANTSKNEPRISVDREPLPTPTEVIAAVAGGGGAVAAELGSALWAFLSGATHSVRYALLSSIGLAIPPTSPIEALRAGLWTTARTTHLIGATIARACIGGAGAQLQLHGWETDDWHDAVEAAERHITAILQATADRPN